MPDTRALQERSEKLKEPSMAPSPVGWPPLDDGAALLGLTFIIIRVVSEILDPAAGRDGKASRKLLRRPWVCLQLWKIRRLPFQFLGRGPGQCHWAVECWLNGIMKVPSPGLCSVLCGPSQVVKKRRRGNSGIEGFPGCLHSELPVPIHRASAHQDKGELRFPFSFKEPRNPTV